jgi:ABC-type Fe3+ transport system permease subunit
MTEADSELDRLPWWLRAMYAVFLIAVLSLLLLVLQNVFTTVEPEGSELHHLFVFDIAWPVFLMAGLATLIAGVAALVVGRVAIGRSADSIRGLGGGLRGGGGTRHRRH